MKIAVCPKHPKKHTRFVTVAHISQDWIVDKYGNFIDVQAECLDVTAKPDRGNIWTCYDCAEEAVFKDVEE